ncbi:MAG: HIT family protein [Patescibacteria group bacterium]|nr:HIT family protein [Patescibacteria group bacterium]MDD5490720.1 HIT family protein [Patescibacteria group bacterium]
MNDCIFCNIIKGEIPSAKVYEDDEIFAFLDINPVNPGHTLVIPKEHYDDFSLTPNELLSKMMPVIDKISKAIMNGLGAQGFNLELNNGRVAGQIVPHAHFHIVPRFPDDGLHLWPGKPYAEGEMQKTAEKIKNNLE